MPTLKLFEYAPSPSASACDAVHIGIHILIIILTTDAFVVVFVA